MGVFVQIAQFLLSLSILIVLHEAGHFFTARMFKIKVEKFYLFFDPWFSLFKIKKGETEYGIGWLPLGGYVKISGMIDESMDKEQMKLPPQPWEFRAKPSWQRLIVMVAGVTVNVILGVLIYCMMTFTWGKEYLPTQNAIYGMHCDSLATKAGLRTSDFIVGIDGKYEPNFSKIAGDIVLNRAHSVQVMRDGKVQNLPISEDLLSQMLKDTKGFIDPYFPCVVDSVAPNTGAFKAGLKKGDRITKVGNKTITWFQDLGPALLKDSNKDVSITYLEGSESKVVTAHIDADGKLGFIPKTDFFQTVKIKYGFFASIPEGIHMGVEAIKNYAKQLKVIFTVKDAHKQIGGFFTMGKAFSRVWDWQAFWGLTAFISIMLAFLNILPIPALDGGHVIFLLYEMLTGRKPNEKVMEYAQYAGMFILLSLIIYANGLDVGRLFHK